MTTKRTETDTTADVKTQATAETKTAEEASSTAQSRVSQLFSSDLTDAEIKDLLPHIRPILKAEADRLNANFQKQQSLLKKELDAAKRAAEMLGDEESLTQVRNYTQSLQKLRDRASRNGVPEYVLRHLKDVDSIIEAEDDWAKNKKAVKDGVGDDEDALYNTVLSALKKAGVNLPSKGAVDERTLPANLPSSAAHKKSIADLADGDTFDEKEAEKVLRQIGLKR